jgi:hypothetical protein
MYCLILDPPWVRLALAKNDFLRAFGYPKSRLPRYFCSPVFGLGCALFAAFFPAEKATQGARVLELVAALDSEVDLFNGGF